jgi:hypothetical protein
MRLRRAFLWPLAVAAALAPVAAAEAQTAVPDGGSARWMLGLGAQADESDGQSLLGTFYVGVGESTWLTFAAGTSSSPAERADIEADTLVIGMDHRFTNVGFTLDAEHWGDAGVLETQDLAGSVYFDRRRWRIALRYESRDIEIPFTLTGPLGGTLQRTVDVPADGIAVNGHVALAERWRLHLGAADYDYERNLNLLPRIESLNWLSASTLTLANSFLDYQRWLAVERRFGDVLLNVRVATDRSAVDGSELDTLDVAVLFPIGRRFDLEVNLGHGRADLFDAGLYGGLMFVIYGG